MSRTAAPRRDEKTGTWWFIVDVPPGSDGKRRQARRRGFTTKRDAQAALDKLRVAAGEGTVVEASKVTLAGYLQQWLSVRATSGLGAGTVASYRWMIARKIAPHIGGVRLQALVPGHLDALYARLLAEGLTPRTTRYAHAIVRKALGDAVRKGLVIRNVADLADPPSAKAARAPEMAFWTPTELATFLAGTADEPLFPLWRLLSMTALRRGEACGLQWADVDLERGVLWVHRQLNVVEGQLLFAEHAKSDHGRRTIDLDDETVRILRRHRAAQAERRLLVGEGWGEGDLVFCGPAGSPIDPESVSQVFRRRVKPLGLPRIRLHDLRHTHCAHLIAAGRNPREISRRLGHASVSFTLDRYGHLMPEADAEAAAAVAALVDGRS